MRVGALRVRKSNKSWQTCVLGGQHRVPDVLVSHVMSDSLFFEDVQGATLARCSGCHASLLTKNALTLHRLRHRKGVNIDTAQMAAKQCPRSALVFGGSTSSAPRAKEHFVETNPRELVLDRHIQPKSRLKLALELGLKPAPVVLG